MRAPRIELLALAAQTAVLLPLSWLAWVNVLAPQWRSGGLGPVLAEAATLVLTAWAASAFALVSVYMVVSTAGPEEILRLSLWSAAPAMWLAPAMILMSVLAPGPMLAGLFLLINVTGILVRRVSRGFPLPKPLFRSSLPSLGAALAIQTGAVALWLNYRLIGAALFFCAAAMLTAQSIVAGAYRPKKDPVLPPGLLSPAVAFLLALALTATGIQMNTDGQQGAFESAKTILKRLWHAAPQPAPEPQQAVTKLYLPNEDAAADSKSTDDHGFPGVVLRTGRKQTKQLTVPRPSDGSRSEVLSRPLHIPFTGEYWLYKSYLAPLFSPPNRSAVRFGNPLELSFHTTDYRPLRMEAHQTLNPTLKLDWCSSIQLVVERRGFNDPVAVELSAIDRSKAVLSPGWVTSLGTAVMGPEPSQTLTFPVSSSAKDRICSELEAVFRLQQFTGIQAAAESLHVEIQEMILTP